MRNSKIVLFLLAVLFLEFYLLSTYSYAVNSCECIDNRGKIVGEFNLDTSTNHDPSVLCNAKYPECGLLCKAIVHTKDISSLSKFSDKKAGGQKYLESYSDKVIAKSDIHSSTESYVNASKSVELEAERGNISSTLSPTLTPVSDLSFVEQWVDKYPYDVIGGTELIENKTFKSKFKSLNSEIANDFYRRVANPVKLLVRPVKKQGRFIKISYEDYYGDAFFIRFCIDPKANEMHICWTDATKSTDGTICIRNDGKKIRYHEGYDPEDLEAVISGEYTDNYIKMIKNLIGKWNASFKYIDDNGAVHNIVETIIISTKNFDKDHVDVNYTISNTSADKNLKYYCCNENTYKSNYNGYGFVFQGELSLDLKLLPHQKCGKDQIIKHYKMDGNKLYTVVNGKKVIFSKN